MEGLDSLLHSYTRLPVLQPETQLHLARQVRAWLGWDGPQPVPPAIQRRGVNAKRRLIETNLRLVVTIATKYRRATNRSDDEFQDLIQYGVLGLNRGVELFDPTRGYAPSTYFYWWITQSITRTCSESSSIIRIPEAANHRFKKLSRLISDWETKYGHRPDIETLQRLSGFSRAAIENSVKIGFVKFVRSFDQQVGDGNTTISELLSDPLAVTPDEYCLADESKCQLEAVLGQLPKTDRQIIERTYLNNETAKEIAIDMNLSRTTVQNRRKVALTRAQEIVEIANAFNLQIA